jgi:hypothetical protein
MRAGSDKAGTDWERIFFVGAALVIMLFAAHLQYSVFKAGLYTKSADESARTLTAYAMSKHGFSIPVRAWLPVYQIVLALGLKAWPDLMLMPRVLNNILGLLTLAALGWLAWILFKNRWTVTLTLLLGAAFGPRVVCSVVPFCEMMYAFLLVAGLAFFALWLERPRPARLLAACAFVTLSAGIRYEGWLFVAGMGLMSLFIIWKGKGEAAGSRRSLAVWACLVLGAVPAAWVALLAFRGRELFDVFMRSGLLYARTGRDAVSMISLWKHGPVFQFFVQNLASLNILGVIGVVAFAILAPKWRKWLFLVAAAFCVLGILALAGFAVPTHNYWRSTFVWSLLLVPFCAYWIIEQGRAIGRGRKYAPVAISVVLAAILFFTFERQTATMAVHSDMDRPDLNAAEFIRSYTAGVVVKKERKQKRPLIFIEWNEWHFLHVRVASQRPEEFINVHSLRRIIVRGRIQLTKLMRHNIGLLVVGRGTFYSRRGVFGELRPAYQNARWVVLPVGKDFKLDEKE